MKLQVEDLGFCPCGQRIYASVEHGAIAHDLPQCPEFEAMDPDEFLTYVRRSRGIPDPQPPRN